MSNYTKNTNFTAKDNLTSGDPAKVIKGAEFDTEFNALQTAVNSKADSNNSQLTGTTDAQAVETTGDVTVGGNLSVTGNATIEGNLTFGNADTDTVSFVADVDSSIIPDDDNTYDLGSATKQWRNVYVDGTANIDSLVADTADINGGTIDGVSISGSTASFSGEISANGGIALGDNDKATFGAGDDLQIYHDGSNSYVKDTGTGNLWLQGSSQVNIGGANGTVGVQVNEGSSTALRHNNAVKFTTTSTGVDVTGTVSADGLTSDGNINITGGDNRLDLFNGSGQYSLSRTSTTVELSSGGSVQFKSGATGKMRLDSNGDVSFYEDTGTTAKMVWDASAESLNVGSSQLNFSTTKVQTGSATSPASGFNVFTSSTGDGYLLFSDGNSGNQAYTGQIRYNHASDFMAFGTNGGTERMRIDSAGNVGIGVLSPNAKLDINSSTVNTNAIKLNQVSGASAGNYTSLGSQYSGGSSFCQSQVRFGVESTGAGTGFLAFATGTNSATERMRIDSSGNVGIGTASPTTNYTNTVHVHSATNGASVHLTDSGSGSTANDGLEVFQYGADGYVWERGNGTLRFGTNATERARFDSSGNLLVGTTDTTVYNNSTGSGAMLGANGQMQLASTSTPAYLNRQGTNGTIVDFRKDGSTVGSIATGAGRLDINNAGSGFVSVSSGKFRFLTSANTGSPRFDADTSGVYDLGNSGTKWKDLYLSGGVYLGGTGAANKLDDYETGVWSPQYRAASGSFTTINMDVSNNTYTKIGNTVICHTIIRTDGITQGTASGALQITGLPFTSNGYKGGVTIHRAVSFAGETPISGYVESGTSYFSLFYRSSSTGHTENSQVDDLNLSTTAQNQNYLIITVVYETA